MPPADWKEKFLAALQTSANVGLAAQTAGISRRQVYKHRADDSAFAEAWADALDNSVDMLELEARRRAYEGTLKPVFHQGIQCGTIREYSDTLMIFLLKAHRPERFADFSRAQHDVSMKVQFADGDNPVPAASGAEAAPQ